MSSEYIQAMVEDFEKVTAAFKRELGTLRTGRASPALIEGISVNVSSYGAAMPLKQLASISAPDARLLVVNPWDKGTMSDIEKAIQSSGLGLNPGNDGQIIRVPIPALTTERRRELVKLAGKMTEEAKIKARGVRREYNELFKELQDGKDITEDELKRYLEQVQKTTDEEVAKLDALAAAKEKEVLDS